MGGAQLPNPPAPAVIIGPDGRRHTLFYCFSRELDGLLVELSEDGHPSEGYTFTAFGDHDSDIASLTAALRATAESEIGRCYLEPGPGGVGWRMATDEISGRIAHDGEEGPYRIVVDGRNLSWEELGAALAQVGEGCRFRVTVDGPTMDLRRD